MYEGVCHEASPEPRLPLERIVEHGGRNGEALDEVDAPAHRPWSADEALPGRDRAIALPERHEVLGTPLAGPYPDGFEVLDLGLGCFWGAERIFWQTPGVFTTLVGYAGGITPNPTYEETCTGMTGHAEVVRVVFDPAKVGYEELLRVFWENHDPTQGMRQGNDVGTQYRSVVYTYSEAQQKQAEASRDAYQQELEGAGYGAITTEIREAPDFYAGLSSRTYFDRVTEPVLIHHGTSDDTCPPRWSRRTDRLLRDAGADSTLRLYRGEEHAFVPQWPQSMERTVRFLRRRLRA